MNIAVSGYGQMGQRLVNTIGTSEHALVGIVDSLKQIGVPSFNQLTDTPDVIIDFSHPSQLEDLLDYATQNQVSLVIGTTNYTDEQLQQIIQASTLVPIIHTSNFSIGVQVLLDLVSQLKNQLPDADIEIIETHHRYKEDAPSGTAKMILSKLESDTIVHGREGTSKRTKGEIGVHAIRGGTVAGIHEVQFLLNDEVITVSHRAENKQIFINGALKAAEYLLNQQPGLYTMNDVTKGVQQ